MQAFALDRPLLKSRACPQRQSPRHPTGHKRPSTSIGVASGGATASKCSARGGGAWECWWGAGRPSPALDTASGCTRHSCSPRGSSASGERPIRHRATCARMPWPATGACGRSPRWVGQDREQASSLAAAAIGPSRNGCLGGRIHVHWPLHLHAAACKHLFPRRVCGTAEAATSSERGKALTNRSATQTQWEWIVCLVAFTKPYNCQEAVSQASGARPC